MKPQPLNLEELEKTILSYFDREKERLLKEEQERPDLGGYYAGRKEECSVMKRTIRTHLKREIKQRVKSACELYLRYRDNPRLLCGEHPKYRDEFVDGKITLKEFMEMPEAFLPEHSFLNIYNDWLFKLIFKSVLENDKK